MARVLDGTISSACARVIWNGDSICISRKLRKTRGVVIHYIFVSGHHHYLYLLGDGLLWNRGMFIGKKKEMG
jgi:hypothetical protein